MSVLPRAPASPQRGAMWCRMAGVWERTRPEGSWRAGGAKCGGAPMVEAEERVGRRVLGLVCSV